MNEINSMVKTAKYLLDNASDWQSLSKAVEMLMAVVALQNAQIAALKTWVNDIDNKVEDLS